MAVKPGIAVHRQAVPLEMVDTCLRMIHLDIRHRGISLEDLATWGQHPFLHLREEMPVLAIAKYLDGMLKPPGELIQPHQIIWHLPDEAPDGYPLTPHVDVPPQHTRYTCIAAVAFSAWDERNGSVHAWVPEPEPVELEPGDLLVMDPNVLHSPGINRSGQIRMGLYVRWVEPAAE